MLLHLIFVYTYLLYGVVSLFLNNKVSMLYLLLLLFCSFKVTTNYRVCSVAYIECKVRDVKREDSLMNMFLDPIIDLRYTNHIYPLILLSFMVLTYNLVYLQRIKEIFNSKM
jgi:predicted 2-oxoglutarate/Fe(II)-dependent dioxygenase YbiX